MAATRSGFAEGRRNETKTVCDGVFGVGLTSLCLTRRPNKVTSKQQRRKTAAMPAGHMAACVNPPACAPVGFKHEFGGCGNRVTSLGGRARSIVHFTQQLVGRLPVARLLVLVGTRLNSSH
jgi:hypothetical protein